MNLTSRKMNFKFSTSPLNEEDKGVKLAYPSDLRTSHSKEEFHVDYLKNKILDVARPNLFKVDIHVPTVIQKDWGSNNNLLVLVKSSKIPSITVKEYVHERAGQRISIPTNNTEYGEASITFYADSNMDLRTLFNRWQRFACSNPSLNAGSILGLMLDGSITIFQYDYNLNPVYGVKLVHAWPHTISEMEVSQTSENSIGEFTVDFKYAYQEVVRNNG